MLELLGFNNNRKEKQGRKDVDEMANRVYDTYKIYKIKRCEKEAPEEINVYSDGSLINIRTNSFKLAGVGVWWPNRKNSEMPLSEAEEELALANQKDEGLGQRRWNGGKHHKSRDSCRYNRYGS